MVRLTGPSVGAFVASRLGRPLEPRRATLVRWPSREGRILDEAVATFFAAPRSYTGEDLLELSLHGNPLLVHQVLADLHESGFPLAGPGEFTRRAVENGRIDLSRAESVGAVVAAETNGSLEAARRILTGGLADRIAPLRTALVELSARLELEVDFAEEEAVPGGLDLLPWLDRARAELQAMLAAQARIEARGHAPRVVLAGAPNAGKSSLSNALLGEDRLLVSPIAGTTRDWIEIPVPTAAGPVVLVDTAGLGDPTDALDRLAQERTRQALARADFLLVVAEAGRDLSETEVGLLAGTPGLALRTKSDLHPAWACPEGQLAVSSVTLAGMDVVRSRLATLVGSEIGADEVALVGDRQRRSALAAESSLRDAGGAIEVGTPEIAAWHARQALSNLAELVGDVAPDEVLGVVFSSFCIGK